MNKQRTLKEILMHKYRAFQKYLTDKVFQGMEESRRPNRTVCRTIEGNTKELFYQIIIMLTSKKIWYLICLVIAILIFKNKNKMNNILFSLLILITILTTYNSIRSSTILFNMFNLSLNGLLIGYQRKSPILLYQLFLAKEILLFVHRLTNTTNYLY